MKIRLDFVTNSSSSSYYLDKNVSIVFIDSSNEYRFSLSEEKSEAAPNRKEEYAPSEFEKYVNWHYLMKGTKPTIGKIMAGKGISSFAEYLRQNTKEIGDYYVLVEQKKYQIGYGESELDDFERYERLLVSNLHPSIREYFEQKKLIAELISSDFCKFSGFWIEENQITGAPDGNCYFFKFILSRENRTADFYRFLYNRAGSPVLTFNEIKSMLKKCSLTDEMIADMEKRNIGVLYVANKTKLNDVIVYFDSSKHICVESISSFINNFNNTSKN